MKGEKWPHEQGEMAWYVFPSHGASDHDDFHIFVFSGAGSLGEPSSSARVQGR